LGIAEVKVGLCREKQVQVPFPGRLVPFPGRTAEDTHPVVRRALGGSRLPDVPVALRVVARGARLAKPAVAIGGVIGDQVEDYSDAAAASLANQSFEGAKVTQLGMDVAVVADIVAPVFERRGIDGSKPDRVDAQRSVGTIIQVVQVRGNAVEIADAVTVRIC